MEIIAIPLIITIMIFVIVAPIIPSIILLATSLFQTMDFVRQKNKVYVGKCKVVRALPQKNHILIDWNSTIREIKVKKALYEQICNNAISFVDVWILKNRTRIYAEYKEPTNKKIIILTILWTLAIIFTVLGCILCHISLERVMNAIASV
jgi:hypothetical protein